MVNKMDVRLRLGNRLDGQRPMRAKMRMFRAGERLLSSYEYDTLHDNAGSDDDIMPPKKHIVVDEVKRFFDRCGKGPDGAPPVITDPRMTTGAAMFAVMDDGDLKYWKRIPSTEIGMEQGAFRSWGMNDDVNQDVGLRLAVISQKKMSQPVYFDNASLKISNILWEFSPDSGAGKWYQLYDLPNRTYTRVTLPDPTNTLKVRAISSNPQEWIQAIAVTPRPDYQAGFVGSEVVQPIANATVDPTGYVRWDDAKLSGGTPIYSIEVDGVTVGSTRAPYFYLESYDEGQVVSIVAQYPDGESAEVVAAQKS